MKFPSFDLERIQSIYENSVEINLTESGIEPLSLKELMNPKELEELLNLPLGYGYTHCLLYTSPSPRDRQKSRMPSSA